MSMSQFNKFSFTNPGVRSDVRVEVRARSSTISHVPITTRTSRPPSSSTTRKNLKPHDMNPLMTHSKSNLRSMSTPCLPSRPHKRHSSSSSGVSRGESRGFHAGRIKKSTSKSHSTKKLPREAGGHQTAISGHSAGHHSSNHHGGGVGHHQANHSTAPHKSVTKSPANHSAAHHSTHHHTGHTSHHHTAAHVAIHVSHHHPEASKHASAGGATQHHTAPSSKQAPKPAPQPAPALFEKTKNHAHVFDAIKAAVKMSAAGAVVKAPTKSSNVANVAKVMALGHVGINEARHSIQPPEPAEKPASKPAESANKPPTSPPLQSSGAAAGLTSNVPTALSSHVDPSMLQAASGVTGNSGLMAGQISQNGQITDPNMPLEVDMEQYKPLDAAALAEHPEQIGEGEVTMYNGGDEGEDGEEFDEEYDEEEEEEVKRPSDLMRARLIDDSLTVEEDGAPRIPSPMATPMLMTSPLITPRAAPSHLTATPQSPLPPPTLLLTAAPIMSCSAPPAEEDEDEFMEEDEEEEEETTIHLAGSPGTPYFTGEPSPYGENLYNQQPGYDPLDDSQYRMAAPLLEKGGDPSAPFPQYKEVHKSYYYFSQNSDPMKYSFSKAVDNYDASAREDGTYCYSCVMFCGVLMIGAGIIMIIVELFGLFGNKEHMPMALGGAGVLAFGILVLAGAMLLWRRKRSNMKKNAVRV